MQIVSRENIEVTSKPSGPSGDGNDDPGAAQTPAPLDSPSQTADVSAEDSQTSVPAQVFDVATTYAATVTPLSREPTTEAPIANVGQVATTRLCKRCGATIPAGKDRCPACRSFAPANQANRRHGLRAKHAPPDVILSADDVLDGLISDQGGLSEMSTLRRSGAAKIRDVEILAAVAKAHVVKHTLDTPTGREAFGKYLAALDRWIRLAALLGLDRRERDAMTLDDYLSQSDPAEDHDTADAVPVPDDDREPEAP